MIETSSSLEASLLGAGGCIIETENKPAFTGRGPAWLDCPEYSLSFLGSAHSKSSLFFWATVPGWQMGLGSASWAALRADLCPALSCAHAEAQLSQSGFRRVGLSSVLC